jgi:hypothetical protein
LGRLKAEIDEMQIREVALKREIASLGDGAYEGDCFRVTVSTSARTSLDLAAVRAKLSRQWIMAHTTEKLVTSVSVKQKED